MSTRSTFLSLSATLLLNCLVHGQADGDFTISNAAGQTFLGPDNSLPLMGITPGSVTIGTAPVSTSALNVFGGQGALHPFNLLELHSSANTTQGMARWYRGPLTNEQMGRVFFNASPNEGFNMQATRQGGTLWGRNSANAAVLGVYGNGWRLIDDVTFDVFTYLANPRVGYMALGHAANMDNTGTANLPITRLTLVHSTGADAAAADPLRVQRSLRAYRPWMRNGVSYVGNGNWAYVGQRMQMTGTTEQSDSTDYVIGVGDDTPIAGASRFNNISFRFTTDPTLANVGSAGTLEGLEMARFRPFRPNPTAPVEGFFGVGDYANSGGQLPEEIVDVLARTIRVRQLPTATYQAPTSDDDKLVVVRADGRLNWRDASTVGAGAACDWTITPGAGIGVNDVYTAWGPLVDGCPDETDAVGIGTNTPVAKLDLVSSLFPTTVAVNNTMATANLRGITVNATGGTTTNYALDVIAAGSGDNLGMKIAATSSGGSQNRGVRVDVSGTTQNARGFTAFTSGATINGYGGDFISNDATAQYSHGVQGLSQGGTSESMGVRGESLNANATNLNVGVLGSAIGTGALPYKGVRGVAFATHASARLIGVEGTISAGSPAASQIGVYGEIFSGVAGTIQVGVKGKAPDDPAFPDAWAIWSEGRQYSSSSQNWTLSDAMFKTNVQDINDGLTTLMQLSPKTYLMDTAAYGFMGLATGVQYGLVADTAEAVIPDLVRDVTRPADYDSLGNMVNAEMTFKAINYNGLTPIMIAAIQDQQDLIALLQNDNLQLEDQVGLLQDQVDQLAATVTLIQAQLAICCADGTGGMQQQGGAPELRGTDASDARLSIIPNPFTEEAEIHFEVPEDGRIRLEVADGLGQVIQPLFDMHFDRGSYTWPLHASMWPAGGYHIILRLADGSVVRKAVKLGR